MRLKDEPCQNATEAANATVEGNWTECKRGVMILHITKFRESNHLPPSVKQSSGLFVLKGEATVKIYF